MSGMRWPTPQRGYGRHPRSIKARLIFAAVIVVVSFVSYLSTRQDNPLTGESQHVALTVGQEIALGLRAAPELIRQYRGESADSEAQQRIDRVGRRLLDAMLKHERTNDPVYAFEFTLLADAQVVNAFALPGGQVFITRALYDQLGGEDQLAGVLGHEVGHVVHRHGAEHMAKAQLTQGLTAAAAVAADRADAATVAVIVGQLVNMKYGRDDELECDRYGVILLAEAGYDPYAMIDVMRVLEKAGGGGGPAEFLSTHPNPENRIARIEQAIRELGLPPRREPR